jgi:antitoxin FitA
MAVFPSAFLRRQSARVIQRAAIMNSITIRNLDEGLQARLRTQAALHGRSLEDEALDILRCSLHQQGPTGRNLAEAIRARFAPLGGFEMPDIPRDPIREPPSFD